MEKGIRILILIIALSLIGCKEKEPEKTLEQRQTERMNFILDSLGLLDTIVNPNGDTIFQRNDLDKIEATMDSIWKEIYYGQGCNMVIKKHNEKSKTK